MEVRTSTLTSLKRDYAVTLLVNTYGTKNDNQHLFRGTTYIHIHIHINIYIYIYIIYIIYIYR